MSRSLFAATAKDAMDVDVYLCICSNVERLRVPIPKRKEVELCKKKNPRNTDGEGNQHCRSSGRVMQHRKKKPIVCITRVTTITTHTKRTEHTW